MKYIVALWQYSHSPKEIVKRSKSDISRSR